jgi:hypothetical protein
MSHPHGRFGVAEPLHDHCHPQRAKWGGRNHSSGPKTILQRQKEKEKKGLGFGHRSHPQEPWG